MSINEPKTKRGRPTTYKEEYCDKVHEYLETCIDSTVKVLRSENETTGYKGYDEKLVVNIPLLEDFADYISTPYDTMMAWEKAHVEFQRALDKIRHAQKKALIRKGLGNEYNSTIAKLILSSNHGMSERTDANLNVNVTGIDIAIQGE